MTKHKEWQFCPYCASELDTGWECVRCDTDWLPYAYPWWIRLLDRFKKTWDRL